MLNIIKHCMDVWQIEPIYWEHIAGVEKTYLCILSCQKRFPRLLNSAPHRLINVHFVLTTTARQH